MLHTSLRPAQLILCASLILASAANAHPGQRDKQGGHIDRDNNTYHCHEEPCFSQHRQAQQAMQEARLENRQFSSLYQREDWAHWSDLDHDCQDTRAEILIAASQRKVLFKQNNRCRKVLSGAWHDPYTNRTFTKAYQVDIDHIIALAEAHRYGGADWPAAKKEQFANDPDNLIPVQREANRAKGSLPAYQWMPKNLDYWCTYIHSRETVVKKYSLQLPEKERLFNRQIKQIHCQ